MKHRPPKRVDRYSKPTPRRGFRYHALRRLAKSALADELREEQLGHIVHRPHGYAD